MSYNYLDLKKSLEMLSGMKDKLLNHGVLVASESADLTVVPRQMVFLAGDHAHALTYKMVLSNLLYRVERQWKGLQFFPDSGLMDLYLILDKDFRAWYIKRISYVGFKKDEEIRTMTGDLCSTPCLVLRLGNTSYSGDTLDLTKF